MIVLRFVGKSLLGNPLQDPTNRSIAIFTPGKDVENLPTVYWLPGFGGSPDDFKDDDEKAMWQSVVNEARDFGFPFVLVIVDGRTHWGCSQYINSPSTGQYQDYIAQDVVQFVESQFPVSRDRDMRIIAGHSSGGFGALRMGISRPDVFGRVISLAGDALFDITHLPMAQAMDVKMMPFEMIQETMDNFRKPFEGEGNPGYVFALCSCYSPDPSNPPRFDWIYDESQTFRDDVYEKWLEHDPVEILKKNSSAFSSTSSVFIESGMFDECDASESAKELHELIKTRTSCRSHLFLSPATHGGSLPMRFLHSMLWTLKK